MYLARGARLAFNLLFTPNFATLANLRLQLVQVAPVAIVAIGMALVIATEGIDLSVGSTMAISAALLPLYIGYGRMAGDRDRARRRRVVGPVNGRWSRSSECSPSSPPSGYWSPGAGWRWCSPTAG